MNNITYSGLTCISRSYNLKRLDFDKNCKHLILHSGNAKGYYSRGNFLHDQKKSQDFHLFLIVKKGSSCFQDVVIREGIKIARDFKCEIHLSPGQINFENKPTLAIRFRPTEIEHLDTVVKALTKHNIKFVKDKKIEPFQSTIFYKRYIEFKQLQDGVFQDNNIDSRYFIQMPGLISYEEFEKMMNKIKNTTKFKMFDYFLAQLYHKDKMIDFAGVYSKNCQIDMFDEFKKEIIKQYKEV